LLSFFFFQAGLSIVISFAALYGTQEVGIAGAMFTLFFITLQLTAGFGAILFGYLQDRLGPMKALNLTLYIWILTIVLIYLLKPIASSLSIDPKILFIVFANFAGLCLGATQASARAIVGWLSPSNQSGEFYGFWGLSGKLAAVAGVLAFGGLQSLLPLKTAMLVCSVFFVVGLVINQTVRVPVEK
jgi:UMF1 family MFS transporter